MVSTGATTKAPDLNAVSTHQRVIHRIQDGRNGSLSSLLRQLTEPLGEKLNEA